MRDRWGTCQPAWLALAVSLLGVVPASAQPSGTPSPHLEGIGLVERLGETIPLDLAFRNEQGEEVMLGDYFNGERPVLLTLVYYECPTMCHLVLHSLTETLGSMAWTPGDQFDIVTVSFDPRETPAIAREAKDMVLRMLNEPEAADGWRFLTGDEASIEALTEATGFRYRWVEDQEIWAHPSTLVFLSGDGKVSRYMRGIEYRPRTVRTALLEASEGRVGSVLDHVVMYCLQYDPAGNSYVLHAVNVMKLGGGLTVVALGLLLFVFWRREGQRAWRGAAA